VFNTKEFYYDAIWYQTKIPDSIVTEIEKCVRDFPLEDAKIGNQIKSTENKNIRKNKVSFFPGTSWVASFCYYYIKRSNAENFQYDLSEFYSGDCLQYTVYEEGEYYNWHVDSVGPENGFTRKLSFSLQLSNEDEYDGGELQIMDTFGNSTYFAPKERGTIIIFDSRVKHRVRKIKRGTRKSIVGWVMGPKFR
jgi:Rps23 Pro-64 3,4-dihydroxylase Tpa1-like proline 4-hydroxylase